MFRQYVVQPQSNPQPSAHYIYRSRNIRLKLPLLLQLLTRPTSQETRDSAIITGPQSADVLESSMPDKATDTQKN
jgi:hypothetical protein